MKIFVPPLPIGDTEGFEKNDLFGRKALGDSLTHLVTSSTDPIVLALDGGWGMGKTTFLKMWAGELRKQGIPVISFDAFENNYIDDAFAALAREVIQLAQTKAREQDSGVAKITQATLGVAKVLIKTGAKVAVRAATLNALDDGMIAGAAKDISEVAGDVTDKYLNELIADPIRQKDQIDQFKKALADLPKLLSDGKDGRPVVFIIDELDRCKPTFALQLLERIKHFFTVEHLHFILGVNLDQLRNSVSVTYGSNVDANAYLQKFINITTRLTDTDDYATGQPVLRSALKYVDYLIKAEDFPNQDGTYTRNVWKMVGRIAVMTGLGLRELERIYTILALGIAGTRHKSMRPEPILAGLAVLKVCYPALYAQARVGNSAMMMLSSRSLLAKAT